MSGISEFALPGILADIARAAGVDTAVTIARQLGGRRYHFPRDPHPQHPLCALIGQPQARLVGTLLGGERMPVPSARTYLRWYDARSLRMAGASVVEICAALQLTESQVYRLLRGVEAPPREAALGAPTPLIPDVPAGRKKAAANAGQLTLF
ncbi:hypothetical protein [Nitrospirillum viridazoti]|uniref:Mor transcription activator family protein n=1 Tax=Nitrospirillum amazonense TaxID=28077 RepID=A0A560II84_9PROT|nr:hypothetical protein [Nitrospirillum amazonense]TWB58706.1 hypothetical protein FBZ92_109199 [Nitrospirillum amazonense]